MDGIENSPCSKSEPRSSSVPSSPCSSCGSAILDHYLLRVSPDVQFHVACMKCSECGEVLDETKTCFLRNNKPLCKWDFARLYGAKCGLCNCAFKHDELVMKTPSSIYHLDCFRCVVCSRVINKGEKFSCINNKIYCQVDHDAVEAEKSVNVDDENFNIGDKKHFMDHTNSLTSSVTSSRSHNRTSAASMTLKSETKTTRVRTVLNERQLHTLRTCYAVNPRPDALMKEQLVEMTGLNPRVIRVWFQNKRCKDKKRSIIFKQLRQQQDQDNISDSVDSWLTSKGVPMVASSPVCHSSSASSSMLTPIEIQPHPVTAWKMEFNSTCMNNNQIHLDIKQQQKLQHFSNQGIMFSHESNNDSTNKCPLSSYNMPPSVDHYPHIFSPLMDDGTNEDDDTVVSLDDQIGPVPLDLKDSNPLMLPLHARHKKVDHVTNSPPLSSYNSFYSNMENNMNILHTKNNNNNNKHSIKQKSSSKMTSSSDHVTFHPSTSSLVS